VAIHLPHAFKPEHRFRSGSVKMAAQVINGLR
jgi:hypothetical protein